jgi:iron complex transport system ATP-binding protein
MNDDAPAPAALEARRVSATLGTTEVLHGIDLVLSAAAGPASSARTARASRPAEGLAGLLAHRGEVRLFGEAQGKVPARARAAPVVAGPERHGRGSADDLMVYDVAMLGRLPHQRWLAAPSAADREAVERPCAAPRPGTGATARWASSRAASASACCWRARWRSRPRCC